jgi:predicted secreted protein
LVHVGDEIQVTLEENPSTGYRWEPDIDARLLREVDDRYEGDASLPGAPGLRVKAFAAIAAGRTELRLVNRRTWESTSRDDFAVRLEIEP